ncbi:MAG: amidohydrolase family protein [Candidatus Aenigmarchaeota archaeon]|nr:amidohydrolase family protein [Candidatus Aenigmarchaeota archaeon]
MKIIDIHCHIDRKERIVQLLNSMKKNCILKAVLLSWELNFTDAKTKNILEIAKKYPSYFKVAGNIKISNNKHLDKDIQNLKILAEDKKISGIGECPLGYEPYFANDKVYYKLAEICADNKIPLVFHTGDVWTDEKTGGIRDAKVRFAQPLYIDDLATDFSDLNIVICHFGNPWMIDAAEVMYKNKNVYADLSALDVNKPWDTGTKKRLLEAIEYGQCSSKLLFGSDFPLFPADQQIKRVKSLGLSKKDLELAFHGNAKKLFFRT